MSQGNCAVAKKKHNFENRNYIINSVGKGSTNSDIDVRVIVSLLKERKKDPYYQSKLSKLKIPDFCSKDFDKDLIKCISVFQETIQGKGKVDGIVSPKGNTILYLGGVRKVGKHIIVDLDDQNLYAYDGHKNIYKFHCASGDIKHPTATKPSLHNIFRKHKKYRSRKYGAQMDYAMFFTNDGKAIHQSNAVTATSFLRVLGVEALGSHGCVRLSENDAKQLFEWAPMNTPVFVDMA